MSKLTLQTVYVPVNGDYDTAVCNYSSDGWVHEETVIPKEGIFFTQEEYNKHIKEIINQTLETAAEEAICSSDERGLICFIYKESITDTFEETFNKFKV